MFWYKCTFFTEHIMPDLKPIIYGSLQSVVALLLMSVMYKVQLVQIFKKLVVTWLNMIYTK